MYRTPDAPVVMNGRPPCKLTIEFENEEARGHFASWLSGSGEQHYSDYMRAREEEEEGPITVTRFRYHGPTNKGIFLCDNTIRTECGRLTDDE